MNTAFADSFEAWLRLVLIASGKAGLLALLVTVPAMALRKWIAPRWRHLLWLLVFVRLVLPDIGEWRWSAQQWHQPFHETAPVQAPMDSPPVLMSIGETGTPDHVSGPMKFVPPVITASIPQVMPQARTPFSWWQIAGLVWMFGVMVMLGLMVICGIRFQQRMLRGTMPAGEDWQRLLERLRLENGWRRIPTLLVSAHLEGPVLTGLWRPRIVLPATLESLSLEERQHLIAHELAHWRRADLWLQTAASLLLALHWFNPLLWFAHRRLRVESEACADAWVLRSQRQGEARNYGHTLVRLATSSVPVLTLILTPGILGMAGNAHELKERLNELSLGLRRRRGWTLAALGIAGFVGALTFTSPSHSRAETAAEPTMVQGRLVDEQGKPVADSQVTLSPAATPSGKRGIEAKSDADGRFHFDGQAKGEMYSLSFSHHDFVSRTVTVTAGSLNSTDLVLRAKPMLEGTVKDAANGRPVAKARVYVSYWNLQAGYARWTQPGLNTPSFDCIEWNERFAVVSDEQGHYRVPLNLTSSKALYVRVELRDYATFLQKTGEIKEGVNKLDMALSAIPPAVDGKDSRVRGTLLDVDGTPLEQAFVGIAEGRFNATKPIDQNWVDQQLKRRGTGYDSVVNMKRSQAMGLFSLKEVPDILKENALVIAAHPHGFARQPLADFLKTATLRLEPWNTLRATFTAPDGKPMANTKVLMLCKSARPGEDVEWKKVQRLVSGTTGADGRFTFSQILPDSQASIMYGPDDGRITLEPVHFKTGEEREMTFTLKRNDENGSKGRKVVGAITIPEDIKRPFTDVTIFIHALEPGRYTKLLHCDSNGRFAIPGVPSGRYRLMASLSGAGLLVGTFEFSFAEDPAQANFDLGTLAIKKNAGMAFPPKPDTSVPLPLPKGETGTVRLKIQDEQGHPIEAAEVSGKLITPDHVGVGDWKNPNGATNVLSSAAGDAEIQFTRDVPSQPAIAAVSLSVKKKGFKPGYLAQQTDGATPTVTLVAAPRLEVKGSAPGAELWAAFSNSFSRPLQLRMEGGVLDVDVPYPGKQAFLITDQTDPKHWRFSPITPADFASGKTLEWQPKWEPGVVIKGRVSGIETPIHGEAWAHAKVQVQKPVPLGDVRPTNGTEGAASVYWNGFSPVAADGTFSFPGVPVGKLVVQALGPDWLATDPGLADGHSKHLLTNEKPELQLTLVSKPLIKRRIQVRAPDGTPAVGADLHVISSQPEILDFGVGGRTFQFGHVAGEHRAAYERWSGVATPGHHATTDDHGMAVLENQMAGSIQCGVKWKDPKSGKMLQPYFMVPVDPKHEEPFLIDVAAGKGVN